MHPRLTPGHHPANKTTHAPVIGLPSAKHRVFSIADVIMELTLQPCSTTVYADSTGQEPQFDRPKVSSAAMDGTRPRPKSSQSWTCRCITSSSTLCVRCDSSRASGKLRLVGPWVAYSCISFPNSCITTSRTRQVTS